MPYSLSVQGGGPSFAEGSAGGFRQQTFVLTRTGADIAVEGTYRFTPLPGPGGTATVGGAGSATTDVVTPGALVAAGSGQTTVTFTLSIAADAVVEPDETFRIDAAIVVGFDSFLVSGTFLIANDDGIEAPPAPLLPPVFTPVVGARDDAFIIPDNGSLTGNVFFNNGNGGDVASDARLVVAALNGTAGTVGATTVLPSGATVALSSMGYLTYDPGSAFTYLPVGSSVVDTFTYTLDGGSVGRVSVTINGVDNRDRLTGAGPLAGGVDNDTYVVDSSATVITESAGGGSDMALASVNYSIGTAEIELLSARTHGDTSAIRLTGNFYSQTIVGNFGDNVLNGGGGADTLIGLRGNDLYAIADSRAVIVESAGQGDDTVVTSVSYTLAPGVSVEVLSAQDRSGTEALSLKGNELAQIVAGNDGANNLDGGAGADLLIGGDGADRFAFTTALDSGNVDTISDFQLGTDRIGLSSTIFTGIGTTLGGNLFGIGTAATSVDQRLIYNSATGQLFYDADGSGSGAAVLFALMTPGLPLTSGAFEVIAGT